MTAAANKRSGRDSVSWRCVLFSLKGNIIWLEAYGIFAGQSRLRCSPQSAWWGKHHPLDRTFPKPSLQCSNCEFPVTTRMADSVGRLPGSRRIAERNEAGGGRAVHEKDSGAAGHGIPKEQIHGAVAIEVGGPGHRPRQGQVADSLVAGDSGSIHETDQQVASRGV